MRPFFAPLSLLFLLVLLTGLVDTSVANPLTGKPAPEPQPDNVRLIPVPEVLADVISKITVLQLELKQKISADVHAFKSSGSIAALLPLFLLCFLYGAVHAAGPGHGKAIAMSYVLAKGKGYRYGLLLGVLIAIIHAGSAILIVFLLRFLFEKTLSTNLDSATQVTQIFSYGLISLIGLYLLGIGLYSLVKGVVDQHKESADRKHFTNAFYTALAIGIVPCPGVIMVLLFSLSLEQVILGMLLCVAVSIGMALTITVSVWISITGKRLIMRFTAKEKKGFVFIEHVFSCISGLLLTTIGGLFLVASL